MSRKYGATGVANQARAAASCGIFSGSRVRDMQAAESEALEIAQEAAIDRFDSHHRFTAEDIRALHRLWIGIMNRWPRYSRGSSCALGTAPLPAGGEGRGTGRGVGCPALEGRADTFDC